MAFLHPALPIQMTMWMFQNLQWPQAVKPFPSQKQPPSVSWTLCLSVIALAGQFMFSYDPSLPVALTELYPAWARTFE
jgi:hypothetical protein